MLWGFQSLLYCLTEKKYTQFHYRSFSFVSCQSTKMSTNNMNILHLFLNWTTVVVFFILNIQVSGTNDSCPQICYADLLITDTHKPTQTCVVINQKLKSNFKEWTFSDTPLLQDRFPIDPDERNSIRQVKNALFSIVYPTPFKSGPVLAAYSEEVLQEILDMDPKIVNSRNFVLVVSGGAVLKGPPPLSHRYGGHQFGVWADQLGDGRAHMLGEYTNANGRRWELQLKGSGLTPYSRSADGRAVIRSSVREFLCSEAMYYLGVPTSRAATLAVSDDKIWRDRFYNGNHQQERTAVVLRLAPSWFRIGSFEILQREGEIDLLRMLADFVIEQYFKDIDVKDESKYLALFSKVVEQTAEMIAKWQSVGFAHGVCNTDNFSILSITIDYGPFRFLDAFEPDMVPNASDDEHRYSYQNQPQVGYYNLDKLRLALLPLVPRELRGVFDDILQGYADIYKAKFMEIFRKKLGLVGKEKDDEYLVALLLKIMEDTRSDFTMTFRQLGDWDIDLITEGQIDRRLWTLQILDNHDQFDLWTKLYSDRISKSEPKQDDRRRLMHGVNPRYVLRNWIAEDIIRKVEVDDFSLLQTAAVILQSPFDEQPQAELLGYSDPPPAWASDIKVSCSS